MIVLKRSLLFVCFLGMAFQTFSQERDLSFFEPADSLHRGRFWTAVSGAAVTYAGISIGLYQAWYKNYDLSPFHTFNDYGEWENMDKLGHLTTTYHESRLCFQGARWTGLSHRKSVLTGVGMGLFLQSTLEVMDGFSTKWGFSWSDMAFNVAGASLFAAQELTWQDQRFVLKYSAFPASHSKANIISTNGNGISSLDNRANDLFGKHYIERFLKDYNGQTQWLSMNPSSFLRQPPGWLPKWLNVAVGYGAGNLYGGYTNSWSEGGNDFVLSSDEYPRFHEYYLSLDIDFTRISTDSYFLKSLLHVINFIKVPSPTLEWSRGRLHFHPIYW